VCSEIHTVFIVLKALVKPPVEINVLASRNSWAGV
jgi:hypothetical protein